MEKQRLYRNDDYRRFVQKQLCAVHKAEGRQQTSSTEHAHIETGGMGIKASDYRGIPLCHDCHAQFDNGQGRYTFLQQHPLFDPIRVNRDMLERYLAKKEKSGELQVLPDHILDYQNGMLTMEIVDKYQMSTLKLYKDLDKYDIPRRRDTDAGDLTRQTIITVFQERVENDQSTALRSIAKEVGKRLETSVSHEWVRLVLDDEGLK